MPRRRIAVYLAATLVVGCLSTLFGAEAGARRTASVSLTTVTPKINLGAQPTFRYSTTGVPLDGEVRLQHYVSGSWVTIEERLPGTNKTLKADAPSTIGRHTYRMRAFNHEGTQLAQTAHNHDVYVFRNIGIQALCPATTGNRICTKVFVTVNGTKIEMRMAMGTAVYPSYYATARFARTSCRSADLKFATKTGSVKSWVKLVQGTHSYGASAAVNHVGHLTTSSLTSAQLFFDASVQSGTSVYLNGTMNCWTGNGTY